MNITLTIPDKHVPELLAVIASMLNKPSLDTTPDHPEFDLAETSLENNDDDTTMRELPWDSSWPEPPPLPSGKTRWVNRGTFEFEHIGATGRCVYFLAEVAKRWTPTTWFSYPSHHIEAV